MERGQEEQSPTSVTVTLIPANPTDDIARRVVTLTPTYDTIAIGRSSKVETKHLVPARDNAWFDSRVMSRNHANIVLSLHKQEVCITDLGSMHGTWLNGKKLTEGNKTRLETNDVLTFGTKVTRGADSFDPLKVRLEMSWPKEESAAAAEPPKLPLRHPPNTFVVPDDDSSDSEDDMLAMGIRRHQRIREVLANSSAGSFMSNIQSAVDNTGKPIIVINDAEEEQKDGSPKRPILVEPEELEFTLHPEGPPGAKSPRSTKSTVFFEDEGREFESDGLYDVDSEEEPEEESEGEEELEGEELENGELESPPPVPDYYLQLEQYMPDEDDEEDDDFSCGDSSESVSDHILDSDIDTSDDEDSLAFTSPCSRIPREQLGSEPKADFPSTPESLTRSCAAPSIESVRNEGPATGSTQTQPMPTVVQPCNVMGRMEYRNYPPRNFTPFQPMGGPQNTTVGSTQSISCQSAEKHSIFNYPDLWDCSMPRPPSPSDKAMARPNSYSPLGAPYYGLPRSTCHWAPLSADQHPMPTVPPAMIATYTEGPFAMKDSSTHPPPPPMSGDLYSMSQTNDTHTKESSESARAASLREFARQSYPSVHTPEPPAVQLCKDIDCNKSTTDIPRPVLDPIAPSDKLKKQEYVEKRNSSANESVPGSRISVANLVSDNSKTVKGTKRKADELEKDEEMPRSEESLPDAQPRVMLADVVESESQLTNLTTDENAQEPVTVAAQSAVAASGEEPPRKRVAVEKLKAPPRSSFTRYVASALVGAVVGGVGVVAALASLPPDYFN
ncbi:hypothetical protein AJ80_05720 [Polytolypa hystricis UAMH7299]|uniref:FHA domain-containing protein n=1 Tax=Polytolypa hystricis (strain UAMH7299) TaxID=1447883 RepID=A0A2B7Y2M4_POLH7|nr:hypothetical protein AJ80_05720 [Polytolypa hystricis UAMH7299]